MNYLAHLYLASDCTESILGNLMGDFVKGPLDPALPHGLRDGITQHRRIDSYTDAHPAVLASKRRISPEYRRYAGILIDMIYDHFLAKYWDQYATMTLPAFTGRTYQIVTDYQLRLPTRMQLSMRYMVANDLLGSYREIDGIQAALRGIETRLRRPSRLGEAITELEGAYPTLLADFQVFFPQLIAFVDSNNPDAPLRAGKNYTHRAIAAGARPGLR